MRKKQLSDKKLEQLLEQLNQKVDIPYRADIVRKLARIVPNEKVVQMLISLLEDAEWQVRYESTKALHSVWSSDPEPYADLTTYVETRLDDVNFLIQLEAVTHLLFAIEKNRFPQATLVNYLIQTFDTNNPEIQDELFKQIWGCYWGFFGVGERVLRDKKLLTTLIRLLKSSHKEVRSNAAAALGWQQSHEAIQALLDLLKDQEDMVKASAVYSLGKLKAQESVDILIRLLEPLSPKSWLTRTIVETLGNIGDARAVEILERITKIDIPPYDYAFTIPYTAADSLLKIGTKAAIEAAVLFWNKELNTEDAPRLSRQLSATYHLETIGTPEALKLLEVWRSKQNDLK